MSEIIQLARIFIIVYLIVLINIKPATMRFLEPVLLLLLHHSPAHGYTLVERLNEFGLEGRDSSVVYRALRDMEEKGWVTSTWDEERTKGPEATAEKPSSSAIRA